MFHRDFFLHPAGKALRKARGKPEREIPSPLMERGRVGVIWEIGGFPVQRGIEFHDRFLLSFPIIFPKGEEK
jgi:hypothetical protein